MFEPLAPGVPMRPSEPIIRQAFLEPPYRWWLRRAWGSGPAILWCGLNPSLANGERDDPTMWEEMGFSFRWGYGSLIKVNLYPFISPKPSIMREWRKSWEKGNAARGAFDLNIVRVCEAIAETDTQVAAWGNGADDHDLREFLGAIDNNLKARPDWKCLRRTSSGAPTHTLARGIHRVPRTKALEPWCIR